MTCPEPSTVTGELPCRVVIVHGYGASVDSHWFPWLARTLTDTGMLVTVVELPTPDQPDTDQWKRAVADAVGEPDARTWIVAHSLGAITALRALDTLTGPWELGGLVLVAGFTETLRALPNLDGYLEYDVDAERIATRTQNRVVIRSDHDDYIPTSASDDLARRLNADLHIHEGAGHFLDTDGITTLPLAADLIAKAAT